MHENQSRTDFRTIETHSYEFSSPTQFSPELKKKHLIERRKSENHCTKPNTQFSTQNQLRLKFSAQFNSALLVINQTPCQNHFPKTKNQTQFTKINLIHIRANFYCITASFIKPVKPYTNILFLNLEKQIMTNKCTQIKPQKEKEKGFLQQQ